MIHSFKVILEVELAVYIHDHQEKSYSKHFYTIKPLVLQSVDQIKFTENTDYQLLESSSHLD